MDGLGLVPLLFLLCSSLLTATTNADDPLAPFPCFLQICLKNESFCQTNTNDTGGSAFQANLGALLASLPGSAAASWGFAENATGAAPDQAYGLAQCRRDVNASVCATCLDRLAQVAGSCPGQKSAMTLSETCMLRYSSESFFGAADANVTWYYNDPQNATQARLLTSRRLMDNLTETAAYGSPRMFAAGAADLSPFVRIYGPAQCTGDLRRDDCANCLQGAVADVPTYCDGKQGCQIFRVSCYIRFEASPFYNEHAVEAAMSPAPASGGGVLNGGDHSSPATTAAGSSRPVRSTALLVSIPVAFTLLLLLAAIYICKKNRKPHGHVQIASDRHVDLEEMSSSDPLQYDLSTLRAATDNFSVENKLGQGGFGPVYKGTLKNNQEIAVKRLSTISQQGFVEMKNEIVLVAKLQHKNLVHLLGFCIEGEEKLLVYEFLCNKSLDKILFGPARQQDLSWELRYKIILGIGRGLLYLQEDSRLTIIHRDLKAGNILLDMDMNPKISDFGLARLFSIDASSENTSHIAGTFGYMAPEYAQHGIISTKSDVFSYGVLLMEIITGRRAYDDLLNFVWRHWSHGSVQHLLEGCPADERGRQDMLRCIHIGLLCVQEDPHSRPSMASVVPMLNNRSITLSAPTEPAFVTPRERPRAAAQAPSINQVSISDLEPR